MQVLSATSDDGTRLRLIRWGSGPRDVLLVHGLAEHAGRYEHVAQALNAAGYRVTIVELRGHGESDGRRGHTQAWHRYVEDVQAAAATIQRPFALVAHSMGGLVTLDALREPMVPQVLGVALSNPLLEPSNPLSSRRVKVMRQLARVLPWLPVRTDLDTALLSRDRDVVLAYEADPAVYPSVSLRWGSEMLAATERVVSDPPQLEVPLRLMLGSADGICSPTAGAKVADRWPGTRKEKVVYDGFYHELFNEPERDLVLDGLVDWLHTLSWPTSQETPNA